MKTMDILQLIKFCDERARTCSESCNQSHIRACLNQVRGAIWVFTGKDPGINFDNLEDILKILNVKYTIKNGVVEYNV
jgi:hypothetical protein